MEENQICQSNNENVTMFCVMQSRTKAAGKWWTIMTGNKKH